MQGVPTNLVEWVDRGAVLLLLLLTVRCIQVRIASRRVCTSQNRWRPLLLLLLLR